MKALKILAGLSLLAICLFVIAGEQLSGTSADASVNARITTVSAPISGQLQYVNRPLGAKVTIGSPLVTIRDPLVESAQLQELLAQAQTLQAEDIALVKQLQAIESKIDQLEKRSRNYSEERERQLETLLQAQKAKTSSAEAKLRYSQLALERSTGLDGRGVETSSTLNNKELLAAIARHELENAKAEEAAASVMLQAARRGLFLGDGYNDEPYSQQRLSELEVEQTRLSAQHTENLRRKAILEGRISGERQDVARHETQSLDANVNGLIWTYLASRGETVQRGEQLMQLVDCDSVMVTLSVSENVYNSLQLGAHAVFRMNGGSQLLSATVIRLGGAGASALYKHLAVAPSERHLERYDVTLDVPVLRENSEFYCRIGRTGRVFFQARPLDWFRSFWN